MLPFDHVKLDAICYPFCTDIYVWYLWLVIFAGAFERFRGILHEGEIDKRVQFLIEGLFAIRKAKFQV